MAESSPLKVTEETTNGTRLLRLVIDGGTHVLREFLHSIHPPATLQGVFKNKRGTLRYLKSIGVITNSQWKTLFSGFSGDPLNSKTFDITLLCILLRNVCSLKASSTGWEKETAVGDDSREANIVRIRHRRNELCHSFSTGITNDEFEDKWDAISSTLVALGLDQQDVDRLKTEPIDHDTQRRVEEEVNKWKLEIEPRVENLELGFQEIKGELSSIQSSIFDQASSELSNCLPDKVSNVFGRDKEIRQVREAVQSGAIAAVVITGGPGFGKTTVAKEVAHELAKPENDKTVLFCSLRSKETFDEIATEIILCIGEFHSQLPQKQKLKKWSQQLKDLKQIKQVTFVLDNVDDVLESKDRQKFVSILKDMRTLSGLKVTFVITSRTVFGDPDLQMKEVRLSSLSAEDAIKVLTSRVTDPDNLKKLSKADKLVELCGHVPLALHIVGHHLFYINQDELITSLQEKPLDVLQEGDISVKKAIKTSFDLLAEFEQEALMLMSLFPGSFDSNAALAVIRVTTDSETDSQSGHDPISIRLLPLVKGPLVENLGSCRYEIHPLIQTFLKRIGQSKSSKYPKLLNRGKNQACIYFICRLADNANMYWSKDKCKESIEAFNEDRHNFEHFLQVYAQGRENQDEGIIDACKTFSDDFPQKCMYLEMCVRPRFYTEILQRLLDTSNSENQPVYRVELLCLLGHKSRKDGNQQKYKELMEEAEKIHPKNHAKFKTKPLSEVYFLNSHVHFLSEKKDSNEKERMQEETKTALSVSKKQLKVNHPQAIVTISRAGMNAKGRKKFNEAKQKLNEALELNKKYLGKHFMTASAHKNIADLYLLSPGTAELDTCLEHYADAIKLLEDLGMGDRKESVLTLKNFAICHARKKNFDEAIKQLKKAEQVAERELEEDHKWKVLIKTELAILHDKMEHPDQAKEVMLEGLLMGKRLNLSIAKMRGKHKIREFNSKQSKTHC